ncbi:MAG: cell division protein FtsA [Candidatus Lloydbacteria bacterium RIFCSPHIGHO2_02_FULL_54_17]|uniref:Cell division protein FtsA n=1 Tax=Candidatus Lloydbacteria bacterium RIFCSPHIGHO2_02_FULL_54_17 TaxID=1798664 RepID=A0A1G2DFH4_9BACT|nr:MAG: cell division protein FtsA [Candidatus Lloydbacteria bacterium RIFCSPHIGHO2_01_FULL_54_11]OGZ11620.1 MAG: cell division protein FtsA [Candidatus Lloydbacteria bacterium RIFCSPHIGHO2_02_FULL_54_17]OGZ13930.1 MAG: cell division protein FtsA [Candidatus Lloydbacteria bacterium RIFCSPLOWO2_01_FULL_54_18]OGZ16984.1 MAG: cell division protein FtsA [Candidatus Lloydbacteria bacterium RIFCSPLOWO2_02_FULL_54_12]
MPSKRIITGVDIGTNTVRVVITEYTGTLGLPHILGVGKAESRGLRHGYITNIADTVRSVRAAVEEAEKTSGIRIREAYLSVGGVGLEGVQTTGAAIISRADSEIGDNDVERAHRACEQNLTNSANKKILHTIPVEYTIDGKRVYGRPSGMRGLKLEAKCLIITCLDQHLNDMIRAVEEAGIEPIDACASPIAASFVALTKAQKMAGCILANIGAETLSIVVYEEGIPVSLEVFPIGSTDITNDIALGLKIPLEEAEAIKLGHGGHQFPKRKLNDIILSRLEDMFNLVIAHLKKIGKHELLPAGIILTGGGSGIETIEDFARVAMRLPSKIPLINFDFASNQKTKKQIKDTSWFVAYGLAIWGVTNDRTGLSGGDQILARIKESFGNLVKQLLP